MSRAGLLFLSFPFYYHFEVGAIWLIVAIACAIHGIREHRRQKEEDRIKEIEERMRNEKRSVA